MARSIVDYFSQNYEELVRLSVKVCARFSMDPLPVAEDILHDVAVVLCKKEKELSDLTDYGAYIAVCLRRAAINYVKRQARSVPVDGTRIVNWPQGDRENRTYDYLEWVQTLEKELQRFDPLMRRAFIAHYIDDVPSHDLAQDLGITQKALSLRFAKMRRALKSRAPGMFRHLNILLML